MDAARSWPLVCAEDVYALIVDILDFLNIKEGKGGDIYRGYVWIVGRKMNIKDKETVMVGCACGAYDHSPQKIHSCFISPNKYTICKSRAKGNGISHYIPRVVFGWNVGVE